MTSEVAVMNRLGVALATDSTSSVRGERLKFYQADKLFMLSSTEPVGIMVHNNSMLGDIPWETIIKVFREELGPTSFERLHMYGDALIKFLQKRTSEMMSASLQDRSFVDAFADQLITIRKAIRREWIDAATGGKENTAQLLESIKDKVIASVIENWERYPIHSEYGFPADVGRELVGRLSYDINQEADSVDAFSKEQKSRLYDLARLMVQRQRVLPNHSGIVVAGFGTKDFTPVLQEYTFYGVYNNFVKCQKGDRTDLSVSEAEVKTFAQSEAASMLLYGSHPDLHSWTTELVVTSFMTQAYALIDNFPGVSKKRKSAYLEEVRPLLRDTTAELAELVEKRRDEKHYKPIKQAIAHLPKGELAHVASTLVSLSSFQKRVSFDEDETVGGPVDVAVITKGDGFVWINRKHYFQPEMNPHFLSRRARQSQASAGPNGPMQLSHSDASAGTHGTGAETTTWKTQPGEQHGPDESPPH